MKTNLHTIFITVLAFAALLASTRAEAQVKHVQYYDSLRIITHDRSAAKFVELIERGSEEAKEGTITLYQMKGDSAIMLEKGSYATVFQPRKVHGQLVKWYPNGKRFSVKNYSNGVADGVDLEWYNNDTLRHSMQFKQGKYDGELKTYYKSGKLKREELYKDGEQVYGRCYNEQGEEIAFVPYREMPAFPGGEQALLSYLKEHIRYPATSARSGAKGVVVLRFVVDKAGKITNLHVIQGVNEELNAEAVRVVQKMPKWKPGTLEGELADVQYFLPVSFKIY